MQTNTNRRDFFRYAALNIMGMIGLSCYILADTYFVARGLGADGLAALNLAIPIYSFVHGSGLLFGVGGATKYAVFCGQRNRSMADRAFSRTLELAGLFAVLYFFAGLVFAGGITQLLGVDGAVLDMTRTYIRMILLFAPAFMLNDILVCFVRNDGNPKLAMTAMLTGSFSNIILDYIFIFPCQMGLFGAVLATGLAPVISIFILLIHFRRETHFRYIRERGSTRLAVSILALGVPSLVTEVASGVTMIVLNVIILGLQGNMGVAAYGVIANLSLVAVSIYTGLAQGMQPLVSTSYGQKDPQSVRLFLRYALITMFMISVVVYSGIYWFADPIAGAFNQAGNETLQHMAVYGLKLYFTAMPFAGFNIILAMYFTATERPVPAQLISLLRGILFLLPVAFLLSALLEMTGVWLALTVTEGFVAALAVVLLCKSAGAIDPDQRYG